MIIRLGSAGILFGFGPRVAMTVKVRWFDALDGREYERGTSARILFGTIVHLQKVGGNRQVLLKVTRKDWRRAMKGNGLGEEKNALLGGNQHAAAPQAS
jgi:hypothetical protein